MDEMNEGRPQWEHYIEYITADVRTPQARDALASYFPGQRPPAYAVQSILPRLNQLGALGWELVHLEPVEVGVNGDIRLGGETAHWTNVYLCAFKRLKRSAEF